MISTTPSIKRLLVVDDEPNVATTIAESLESLGEEFAVDVAFNGQAAMEMAEKQPYDLVITDYKMPGMSGLSLALAITKSSPRTQIIMMTAYGTDTLRSSARVVPVSGFIDKPFSVQEIREHVLRVLDKQAVHRDLAFVIEDNAIVAEVFAKALSIEGYEAEVILQGDVAQKRLEEEKPRLILLDLHLPEVAGADLLNQIRQSSHLKETIVFVATGDAQADMDKHSRDQADMILEKPITFGHLRDLVRRFKNK